MSVNAYRWVWYEIPSKLLKDGERTILLCLAEHADPDGYCFPSYERIARMCDCDRATVYRRLQRLNDLGLVQRVAAGSKRGRSNRYRLALTSPRTNAELTSTEFEALNPSQSATGGYPQPVATDATGHPSQSATPANTDPSRSATDPSRNSATGTRCTATRPEPSIEPSRTSHACGADHRDSYGDPIPCGPHVPDCRRFKLDETDVSRGRSHIAQIREQLSGRSSTDKAPNGSDAR